MIENRIAKIELYLAGEMTQEEEASFREAMEKDPGLRTEVEVMRELDDALAKAASELNCDLVVMGSHVPGFTEHVFASRAGYLASHSNLSVFVVR